MYIELSLFIHTKIKDFVLNHYDKYHNDEEVKIGDSFIHDEKYAVGTPIS